MNKDIERDLSEEATRLIDYLRDRELTPEEACVTMGFALIGIIGNKKIGREYVRTLARQIDTYCEEG